MGSKLGTPGVRTPVSCVSPVSVAGWLVTIMASCLGATQLWVPSTHCPPATLTNCPMRQVLRLPCLSLIKRGHTAWLQVPQQAEGGTQSEVQVCGLECSATSCPLRTLVFSSVKWSVCLPG